MPHVLDCIVNDHDPRLVALAAVLCLFAACTTAGIIQRARLASSHARLGWIAGAGFVAGSGIWATHFVAMLAYRAHFALAYDFNLTLLSVVAAIGLCAAGFAVAIIGARPVLGGAIAGAAVGIMHYTGMAAVSASAHEMWDARYITVSVVLGIAGMAAGMRVAMNARGLKGYFAAATIFTLAICAMHFTGMSAVMFMSDATMQAHHASLEPAAIAIAVAAVAVLILGVGMVTAVTDHHLGLRAVEESRRLRAYVEDLESTKHALERSLQDRAAALVEAAEASNAKSAFLASMSHELRTPLNAIIGFSDMMKMQAFGPMGSAKYKEYAVDIHDSGKHLLSLINDILDLSRLDAAKTEMHEEDLDVAELASSCLKLVEVQAREGGLDLRMEVSPDLPRVRGDERRLKQVLINLLANAVKFTPEGGRVTLHGAAVPDGLELCVADTGIGIEPEDVPRAMEVFSQIDSTIARSHRGAGLGLPLARQLMELHGGTLRLESRKGAGTRAIATLPTARILAREQADAA